MARRLAAILAADVVGYSSMMNKDEAGTLAMLMAYRTGVFDPIVANRGGRVVKLMGDGALAEFPSVVEAVSAALEIQRALAREDGLIQLRIGINLGDVIADGDDIYGDGVNVAARLEKLAEPGGICISSMVRDSLGNRVAADFTDAGHREIKGLLEPIQVWHWSIDGTQPAVSKPAQGPVSEVTPSILVEAIKPAGEAEAATELAEELHSDLVTALSRRSGIKIVSRPGRDIHPAYILQGRCLVSGERCRLHLSMVVAATGESCWSERIDGEVSDLFEFVDKVVIRVSDALRTHHNANAGAALAVRPDDTLSLQELLSKAAFFFHCFDARSAELSCAAMAAAAQRAPDDPMVLAMRSWSLFQTVPILIDRAEDVDVKKAVDLADRAIDLGPGIDFVFYNRGTLRLWLKRDHEGCRADAKRSLAVNPGYHKASKNLALVHLFGGEPEEGVRELSEVIQRAPSDPVNPFLGSHAALGYLLMGDTESAICSARDACERRPFQRLHALAYAAAVAERDALTSSTDFRALIDRHDLRVSDIHRLPFADERDIEMLEARLRHAGLPE